MKKIIFTRGVMGAGKSYFLEKYRLEPWTISSDQIRLLLRNPIYGSYGNLNINQTVNKETFQLIRKLIESKIENREFIIIDCTNLNYNFINSYHKMCIDYGYEEYILDFSDVPLDKVLYNNSNRTFRLPKQVLKDTYKQLSEEVEPPSWVKFLKPDNFFREVDYQQKDFSKWKKIHHIGDLHGCYTVLKKYLNGLLKEDELYIFTGDYIDRGLEHKELMSMLISISNKPNVIFIEGNHEKNLFQYANNKETTKYFKEYTMKEMTYFDKKKLRNFYRKLKPFVYYKYNEKSVLVSHGGLTFLPRNFFTISDEQFIRGIGDYKMNVGLLWDKNTKQDQYQVHGHRNTLKLPIINGTRNFVLEGGVEIGGDLRIVTLDATGFNEHYIKNDNK